MKHILVLNGPNLNLLGEREPDIYGSATLDEMMQALEEAAGQRGVTITHRQSNSEGDLIDVLHEVRDQAVGVIFNPAAYTHYSYALRDAISAVGLPTVEVHLSDITGREEWRRVSVIKEVCIGQIMGHGPEGYIMGLDLLLEYLDEK